MFTGIVEEIGTVSQLQRGARSAHLSVNATQVLTGTKLGDSIAVNGVCLTVTDLTTQSFAADVMPETLNRSSLSQLSVGSPVNLERALAATGRFGGHIVAGHVDGLAKIIGIRRDDTAIWYTLQTDFALMRYIVEKGSVALDGISLTVAQVSADSFAVSVIPHTASQTTLPKRRIGDALNLEVDIVGKYVEKLCRPTSETPSSGGITPEFLARCGF